MKYPLRSGERVAIRRPDSSFDGQWGTFELEVHDTAFVRIDGMARPLPFALSDLETGVDRAKRVVPTAFAGSSSYSYEAMRAKGGRP